MSLSHDTQYDGVDPATLRRPHQQLPLQVSPMTAETLQSYLQRITDRNLLRPGWLSHLSRQPHFTTMLSELTGLPERNLASALPELRRPRSFEKWPHLAGQVSASAGTRPACAYCVITRTGGDPPVVTVFAAHEHLVCHTHNRWVGSPELKCPSPEQFSLRACRDISAANVKHQRLVNRWGRSFVYASFAAAVTCLSSWSRWPAVIRTPDIEQRWARLGISEDSAPLAPAEVAAWYPNAVSLCEIILSQRRQLLHAGASTKEVIYESVARLQEVIPGFSPSGASDPFRHAIFADLPEPRAEVEHP